MSVQRNWFGGRVGDFLERWMSSLVVECRCDDGSRLIIGLDPSWYGACAITVLHHVDRR